jgi:hypothetical protein
MFHYDTYRTSRAVNPSVSLFGHLSIATIAIVAVRIIIEKKSRSHKGFHYLSTVAKVGRKPKNICIVGSKLTNESPSCDLGELADEIPNNALVYCSTTTSIRTALLLQLLLLLWSRACSDSHVFCYFRNNKYHDNIP